MQPTPEPRIASWTLPPPLSVTLTHMCLMPPGATATTMWSAAQSSGAAALTEVLTRLLKELAAHMLVAFVDESLCGDKGAVEPWSEPQAAALQVALSRKPAITDECVVALLQQLDVSAVALRKSPKFSNLVFTLVRAYGAQLGGHVELARSVAGQLETFMRAASLAAVEKLG